MTHATSQMPELKPCRCLSYNWNIGEEKNALVDAPFWSDKKNICLDACIAGTIQELWKRGIVTLGSCCGHNRAKPNVIVSESTDPNDVLTILHKIDPRDWEVSRWERVIYTRAASVPSEPKAHRWDSDGERCLDCGDKDWMNAPVCVPREQPPQESVDLNKVKQEAVRWYIQKYDSPGVIGMPSDREVLYDFIDHLAATGRLK